MVTQPNTPTAEDAATIAAKIIASIDKRNAANNAKIIADIVTRAHDIAADYSPMFDFIDAIKDTVYALAGHYGIGIMVDYCGNPVDVHDPQGDRYAADPAARPGYAEQADPRADAVRIVTRLYRLSDELMHAGRNLYADLREHKLDSLAILIAPYDVKEVTEDIAAAMHPTDA